MLVMVTYVARFEILTLPFYMIQVFGGVMLCRLVSGFRHFKGLYHNHIQG